jgi:hypothetical protein
MPAQAESPITAIAASEPKTRAVLRFIMSHRTLQAAYECYTGNN